MEFFYPNWNNDFWRIWGLIAAGDKNHFALPGEKRFDRTRIEEFCRKQGIALYDMAEEVIRLKDNASDNHLQIVRTTDLGTLLQQIPLCHTVASTGQKSAEALSSILELPPLALGECRETVFMGRRLSVWRMPSTSRAYPKPIEWKAEFYRMMQDATCHAR